MRLKTMLATLGSHMGAKIKKNYLGLNAHLIYTYFVWPPQTPHVAPKSGEHDFELHILTLLIKPELGMFSILPFLECI